MLSRERAAVANAARTIATVTRPSPRLGRRVCRDVSTACVPAARQVGLAAAASTAMALRAPQRRPVSFAAVAGLPGTSAHAVTASAPVQGAPATGTTAATACDSTAPAATLRTAQDANADSAAAAADSSVASGHLESGRTQGSTGPPALPCPSPAEVQRSIDAVVELVARDMVASRDLAEQRRRTGLGELLLQPWPTSSHASDPAGAPALAAEFLPYVGSHAAYEEALAAMTTGASWHWEVVAVIQAVGSGRTRLAYTHGSSRPRDLVVMARVCDDAQALTPSWDAFMRLARHWEAALPRIGEHDRRRVAQHALAAMQLLAACHVAFVARALERVAARAGDGAAPPGEYDGAGAAARREAALRSLQGGQGDGAVAGLFLQQLASMVTVEHVAAPAPRVAETDRCGPRSGRGGGGAGGSESGEACTLPVALIDRAAVDRFCAQANADLRRQLWPGAAVVLWWDNADALLSTPRIFQSPHGFARHGPAQQRDCFHGLVCLASDLKAERHWLQVLSGASAEVATLVERSRVSPLHGRVRVVVPTAHVSADDMFGTLQRFLALDAATVAALWPRLDALRGRPVFFYSDFLPAVWRALQAAPAGTPPLDAVGLRRLLLDAADAAATASRRRADANVARTLSLPVPEACRYANSRSDDRTGRSLCSELYAALCLHGGVATLQEDAVDASMRRGLLPLPVVAQRSVPWLGDATVRLREEPATSAALEGRGRAEVLAFRDHPQRDPVYQLLGAAAARDRVQGGFPWSASARGHTLELAFVWHILRCVLLHTTPFAPGPSLRAVLAPLAAPGFVMPSRALGEFVVAARATAGGYLGHSACGGSPGAEDFLRREAGGEREVMYGLNFTGADVAFETVQASGSPASLALAQVKPREGLSACLRAASPAWQHTSPSEQDSALRGDAFKPSERRAAFQEAAAAASTARRLAAAFRIVFSPRGYDPREVEACNALNALPDGTASSPIILCQPSEAAFGRPLSRLPLERPGGAPRPVSGATALASLLPQTVADITAGRVARAGSDAVQRAVALLPSVEQDGKV